MGYMGYMGCMGCLGRKLMFGRGGSDREGERGRQEGKGGEGLGGRILYICT